MIPNELEWRRLYLYTCRIIASQFPVPAVSVPGLFLRAYLDWLVEQAGCRLQIFPDQHKPDVSHRGSPDLTLWMHPARFGDLATAACSRSYCFLTRCRGMGPAVRLCIAPYPGTHLKDLWITATGWANIQTALGLTGDHRLHRFSVGSDRGDRPETVREAMVSVLWCRDIADIAADHLAAICANYFSQPRYFVDNSVASVDIRSFLCSDSLAAYNSSAKRLHIQIKRTDGQGGAGTGFVIDKKVVRLAQNVVRNTPLPGCPLVRPTHSRKVWQQMVEVVENSCHQVRTFS